MRPRKAKNSEAETSSPKLVRSKSEKGIQAQLLVDQPSKWKNWNIRMFWTFVMISGFFLILYSGHGAVILLVGVVQIIVFREVIQIGLSTNQKLQLPWFRLLHYYYLFTANYFLYGEALIFRYRPFMLVHAVLLPLAVHHRFISFFLYCLGLIYFVLHLKKGFYRVQFSHFGWTHMALILIVFQSHFVIDNIFTGLAWFILPSFLVVTNDIFAYVSGFFFGKTPLISLSPKKTWEGFIGGLITIFGYFFASFLAAYPYFTCSLTDYSQTGAKCVVNPVFLPQTFRLPPYLSDVIQLHKIALHYILPGKISLIRIHRLEIIPFQLHAVGFALFASLIAPFGGFFASGLKRAFNIKDFGDSIPGHGGMTDRMDCQFIMGMFANLYFTSFVGKPVEVTVGSVLQFALNNLSSDELKELYINMREYLDGQGVLLT